MELTQKDAEAIVYGELDDWSEVVGTVKVVDFTELLIFKAGVFLHKPTGGHYRLNWTKSATELRMSGLFDYTMGSLRPTRVVKKVVEDGEWVNA